MKFNVYEEVKHGNDILLKSCDSKKEAEQYIKEIKEFDVEHYYPTHYYIFEE